jgi:hypothetical protein
LFIGWENIVGGSRYLSISEGTRKDSRYIFVSDT